MTPQQLIDWRKGAGLSQAEVATLFGYSRVQVGHWERGESPLPKWLPLAILGHQVKTFLQPLLRGD